MAVEVELKAHVDNPDTLRARLRREGTPRRSYLKLDEYYGPGSSLETARYRLRHDGDQFICTFKEKRIHAGIEENRETEFTVSDGVAFRMLLQSLGLRQVITKRKEGSSFLVDGTLVELSHVEHLGWFVELERLLPDTADAAAVSEARDQLRALLARLEIPESSLESRSYNRMIYEAVSSAAPAHSNPV